MCWACYTPLSGNAPLGGLAGAAAVGTMPNVPGGKPSGVPVVEEPQKKGIDPKIIGVGGFLAVAALAAFFITGAMGKTEPDPITPLDPNGGTTTWVAPDTRGGTTTSNVPPPSPGGGSSGGPSIPPAVVPFQVVASPNSEFQTGTMGIMVGANVAPNQAMGFARTARDQYSKNGKWSKMQICVFTDKMAAAAFASYQSKRRGAPLEPTDFIQLGSSVWAGSPAYLESRGKNEKIFSPASSPTTWWQRR